MIRSRSAITAVSAAVAGGALVAVTIGGPSLSAAEVPLDQVIAGDATGAHPGAPGRRPVLDAAAGALGISGDELRDRLEDGDTIADIAAERQVDLSSVTDAMVAAGEKAIDERAAAAKDALPERIQRLVEGRADEGPGGPGPGRFGPGGPGRPGGHHGHWLQEAADAIGLEPAALRDALGQGRSLADIAAEHGVDRDALVAALLAPATERIDRRVADGDLTEQRATAIKDRLSAWVEHLVDRTGPEADDGPD